MTSLPPSSLHFTSTEQDSAALEQRGRALRDEVFGRTVFVRGVIEVSNYCRQNCNYCGMRRDNRSLHRFRLELEMLRELVTHGLPEVITDLNIQTGEDTLGDREIVLPLIETLRREMPQLGISVCLGTLDPKLYDQLREAGASYYIIKIETGNREALSRRPRRRARSKSGWPRFVIWPRRAGSSRQDSFWACRANCPNMWRSHWNC